LWDGNTSNQEKPIHEYDEPGTYTVELIVTDSEWNIQTTYTQVIVSSPSIDTQIITSPHLDSSETFTFTPTINWWVWPFSYSWDLWDGNTSNQEEPNHSYQENGTYNVTLITVDANWLISTAITTVVVIANKNEDFNIELSWTPLTWPGPLNSVLWVDIQGGKWPFEYRWDFADGSDWVGKNISHTFVEQWTYNVIVTVTDANWIIKTETIIINVGPISSEIDSDKDGILDKNDKCPSIKWVGENEGCPIFEQTCNSDADCNENSLCWNNTKGISTCIAVAVKNNCEYNGDSTVFWNVICDTCPCQNTLDFNASLRNCDVVFPAITSPDWSEIYSKWNYYQIKK
jgi:PKD repeat protein